MADRFPLIVDGSGTPAIKEIVSGDVLDLTGVTVKAVSIDTTLAVTGNTTVGGTLGVTGAITGSLTGNASTATSAATLTTARTIGGTSFDGSANIAVALSTEATTLATPRAIALAGDVTGTADFDGSAGISITTTLANDSIVTANITNANVTLAKMAANSIDSDQYVDGSIDTIHIADDQVTGAKLADALTVVTSVTTPLIDAAVVDGENFKINGGQGTDGQVLTSTGSGVAWEDGGGGGVTFKDGGANFTNSLMVGEDSTGTLSSANNNTGVGKGIFAALTTGNSNAILGTNVLSSATTAERNVGIGHNALNDATTAHNNVCIGYEAGGSLTVFGANNNIAIGTEALSTLTDRADNIAIGYRAVGMNDAAVISQVTAVGVLALSDVAFGGYGNTVLGYRAGVACTGALHNTLLGREAGQNITSGDNNICVGYNAVPSGTGTSEIVIGVSATGKGNTTGFIHPNGGGMYQGNNSSSWSTVSDRRIKKNIEDNNVGLDAIDKIRVRNFEYRTEDEIVDFDNPKAAVVEKKGIQLGVIAQEIEEIFPDVVKTEDTGVKSVNPDNLTWYLINAVQELSAEIKKLKGE